MATKMQITMIEETAMQEPVELKTMAIEDLYGYDLRNAHHSIKILLQLPCTIVSKSHKETNSWCKYRQLKYHQCRDNDFVTQWEKMVGTHLVCDDAANCCLNNGNNDLVRDFIVGGWLSIVILQICRQHQCGYVAC